jgi:ubiquitin-conjugating enzyme E2 A
VSDENMHLWQATLFGPEDSIWEGAILNLTLSFGADYPDRPPKVKFTTDMFHPNVYGDGSVCLDILQDKWKPIYTVSSVLVSLRSLLCDPNPSSPANPIAAEIFKSNPKEYAKRVRRCVEHSQGL